MEALAEIVERIIGKLIGRDTGTVGAVFDAAGLGGPSRVILGTAGVAPCRSQNNSTEENREETPTGHFPEVRPAGSHGSESLTFQSAEETALRVVGETVAMVISGGHANAIPAIDQPGATQRSNDGLDRAEWTPDTARDLSQRTLVLIHPRDSQPLIVGQARAFAHGPHGEGEAFGRHHCHAPAAT